MSSKASFSVTRAWSEGLASLPSAWRGAWLGLVVLWAGSALSPYLVMTQIIHPGLMKLAAVVLLLILKIVVLGAVYRIAAFGIKARDEGLGFGGLQFGAPELRLLGGGMLIGAFLTLIAVTLFIVFAIIANVAGGDLHDLMRMSGAVHLSSPQGLLVIGYVVAAFLILAVLAVKFTLAPAASVAERRMVTLNALGLSSGNVGKLFVGLAVIIAPLLVLSAIAMHHLYPRFVLSARPPAFDGMFQSHALVHAGLMGFAVLVVLPATAGFLSSAYRQIVKNRS